jgi:hypothetical protein
MRSASCGRSPFSATLARCSAAPGSASRPDEFARVLGCNGYVRVGCPIPRVHLLILPQGTRSAVAREGSEKRRARAETWRENE